MKRVRARVHGRVQGVMFRDSCRQQADRLGVVGWARNEPDGSVEVEAEGEDDAVDELLAWCRTGPRAAEVTGVDIETIDPSGGRRFDVRW